MIKYSEFRSGSDSDKIVDWNNVLKKSFYDWDEMDALELTKYMNRSRDWVTCACGNQCANIPRYSDGRPKDKDLLRLGSKFSEYICDMALCFVGHNRENPSVKVTFEIARQDAIYCLDGIEYISREIIKSMN